jgi:hypothetical protein
MGFITISSLSYILRIGTLIVSRAENADSFPFISENQRFQRPKRIL